MQLLDNRVKAVHSKDINALMSNYAPDAREFDAVNPLQYIGIAGPRKRAEEWFSAYQGAIGYEIRELTIAAGADLAFCHFLYRISGTMTNGNEVDMWLRATLGCHKLDGKWLVTHEHSSVPFDMESGKAALNLKP